MILDGTGVDAALSALGEQLGYGDAEQVEMIVCGGSALQALGFIGRTTRDVDVLALFRSTTDGHRCLLCAEPLPDSVVSAAAVVARDLELPDNWLNAGPTDLLSQGLPEGLLDRLHSRRYGAKLVIHFIGRFDQICFKLYAAVNGGSAHHLSDLKVLTASEDEMLAAAQWCLTQDASDIFPAIVFSFLEKTGYQNVAERLGADNQE
jgi:hypothetical protein